MALTPRDDTRGIVRPDRLGRFFDLERLAPPARYDDQVDLRRDG